MLRKRSRPVQKEQSKGLLMPDSASDSIVSADGVVQKARSTSFFSAPGLFVGLSTKGLPDSESAKSPTSPLDSKVFSNRGSSFVSSPGSPGPEGQPRSWHCNKVGLGLVDSLNDESKVGGKVLRFSESKNILLGSQMRITFPTPKSLLDGGIRDEPLRAATPKSHHENVGTSAKPRIGSPSSRSCCSKLAIGSEGAGLEPGEFGKIRSWSADIGRSSLPLTRFMYHNRKSGSEMFPSDSKDSRMDSPPLVGNATNFDSFSGSLPISFGSSRGFMASLSASEIELSEDYTCIISHGPNPKTTHIFGDCILESHTIQSPDSKNKLGREGGGSSWLVKCPEDSPPCPSNDFLSNCFSCKKKLEGKDIYMYRGEKAFCSCNCRDREILIEEEMEMPAADSSDSPGSSFHEEIFLAGMAAAS
ncbi:FCS-Like Zinc finger 10-like isoform X2 [Phoenix dactylifera]|nr:FCS-Like Zinc finger 10-like isoform X2 [Phoenix dactylifera]XP_008786308.2 FCS-Like Zinc finger 10-like isoform X2 [Phoenix dactylifera]XP_038986391.1 FCS-Like Zinc finger 10-like isoform X2 [Phoenix dactylifera]